MAKVRTISLGLVAVAAVVWAVSSWSTATNSHDASASPVSAVSVESQSSSPMLAARYHLRNRTNNFFKRSTQPRKSRRSFFGKRADNVELAPEQLVTEQLATEQLAARYHLRNRTNDFFKRSTGKRTGKVQSMPEELAARYHLRNRTNDFFGRSITRGYVS
jgi:outer membrane protein W